MPVSGLVTFDPTDRPSQVAFNALDPLAIELVNAWQPASAPLGITITLTELELL
jgi:hypothetical protein